MEHYDLSLNDLNLIRHLRKVGDFIRFTYNKNIQEKGRSRDFAERGFFTYPKGSEVLYIFCRQEHSKK
jgi:hypothetical protein